MLAGLRRYFYYADIPLLQPQRLLKQAACTNPPQCDSSKLPAHTFCAWNRTTKLYILIQSVIHVLFFS